MKALNLLLISILVLCVSCSQSHKEHKDNSFAAHSESAKMTNKTSAPSDASFADPRESVSSQLIDDNSEYYDRKIIKTANYNIEVENIDGSRQQIRNQIAALDGFISSMDESRRGSNLYCKMSIRVPNGNFDQLLNSINKESKKTNYKRINSNDITEEYVDIESRLSTKKEVKNRYTEILRKKANTVEEVLNTEEKIRKLQEEIDSKEGRLRFLSQASSLSTINLELIQKMEEPLVAQVDFLFAEQLKDAFGNGLFMITQTLLIFVNFWPLVLLFFVLIVWKRKWILTRVKV